MTNQRPVTFLFMLAGVAAGVLVRALIRSLLPLLNAQDPLLVGVQVSTLVGVLGAMVTFFVLLRHEKASAFTDSVVTEMKLVTWPSREETVNNTGIVVGAAIFFAALLAVYDFVWAQLTEIVLYSTG